MGFKRFVNLVVFNCESHLYSLRRLNADQFFHKTAVAAATLAKDLPIQREVQSCRYLRTSQANGKKENQPPAASLELESIRLPPALFSVLPSACPMKHIDQPNLKGFTFSGSKIFFTDSAARLFYYDTQRRCAVTTPNLHAPKSYPFAITVPSSSDDPNSDDAEEDHGLYIMEKILSPAKKFQFEALFCGERRSGKTWYCESLPPPPYVDEPANEHACILSHAVVGDAICISVQGVGTYCFDTVNRTWSRAGDWLMPFMGKAEYIPELKLWFGISEVDGQLPCAADLAPVVRGHPPEKKCIWGNPDVPDEWCPVDYSPTGIVSLGSGRFCIANFFQTMHLNEVDSDFAVFTGLEVIIENETGTASVSKSGSNGSGCSKLRMIKHKSKIWDLLDTNVVKSVH